jgi:hypothetical protein
MMRADLQQEELISRYLLGQLSEEAQIELEDQAFADTNLQEIITGVENDLIDEYVRQEMSAVARSQFESRFLTSINRRRRVELAAALFAVTKTESVSQRNLISVSSELSLRESIFAFLSGFPNLATIGVAAAVITIAIACWQILQMEIPSTFLTTNQQVPPIVHPELVTPVISMPPNQSSDLALKNSSAQPRPNRSIGKHLAEPSGPTTISLVLAAGIARGSETRPRVLVPASARQVQLHVASDPDEQYQKYRVELRDQNGNQVYSKELKLQKSPSGKTLNFTVPVRILQTGRYELTVKGLSDEQPSEVLSFHYFDVSK